MQTEYPHNTDEQTADYLKRTLRIIADAGVTADQFPAVFAGVYASVSGKQIVIERAQAVPDLSGLIGKH